MTYGRAHPELGDISDCRLYYSEKPDPDHFPWSEDVYGFRELEKSEIPQECQYGIEFQTAIVVSWRFGFELG